VVGIAPARCGVTITSVVHDNKDEAGAVDGNGDGNDGNRGTATGIRPPSSTSADSARAGASVFLVSGRSPVRSRPEAPTLSRSNAPPLIAETGRECLTG
jgi:hypothetical protein